MIFHARDFFDNSKNEAENVSMMLNELFLAFQINFHPHKYFYDLEFPL